MSRKKTVLALALALMVVVGMFSSASAAGTITKAQARAIALEDAGYAKSQVLFTESELDRDDGVLYWEIEFYVRAQFLLEFDYEIDARTGRILDKDTDAESYKPRVKKSQAQKIALEAVGVTKSQVRQMKISKDDGVYRVQFVVKATNTLYKVYLNASTGEVIRIDKETKPVDDKPIDMAEAKKIALNHAGYSASQVRFEKVELDRDDGRLVYEIEFDVRRSRKEYSYEIDAFTGKILEWDVDYDD